MMRYLRILPILLLLILLIGCSATSPAPHLAPLSANSEQEDLSQGEELGQDPEALIENLSNALGPAPKNVVGFASGYRKNGVITGTENVALMKFYRSKSATFVTYNMGCTDLISADEMLYYNGDGENKADTGYNKDNTSWLGKSGFNDYDQLGNLASRIGETSIDLVSINQNMKNSSTESAQTIVNSKTFYGYWIISLPDANDLEGTVYNQGTDNRNEPVEKGYLRFRRVGPGPENAVDIEVNVDASGQYESKGQLTAGHYEVSFNADDGKGEMVLNDNWLYIPGDTETMDWYVLVRQTYHVLYEHKGYLGGYEYSLNMEWFNIPIDWKTESDEALEYGTTSGFDGTYCLTYAYFNSESNNVIASQDADDEVETEMVPGFLPEVLNEEPYNDGYNISKMVEVPTLSFFRGAKEGHYIEDAYYINMIYELEATNEAGMPMAIPYVPSAVFSPMWKKHEAELAPQFQELASMARLDTDDVEDLIEKGTPIVISYKWPSGDTIELVIQPQE